MAETTIHLEKYKPDAKSLVASAQSLADERKHNQVEPLHLLYRFLEQPEIVAVFQKVNVDPKVATSMVESALERIAKATNGVAYLSSSMLELLSRAEKDASNDVVGVDNLLNALSCDIKGSVGSILQQFSVGPGDFRPHASTLKAATMIKPSSSFGSFTRDLIARAHDGNFDQIIGRDTEVRRALKILSRSSKNNPLLIGDNGVGKSAIVEAIAQRFDKGEVPPNISKMAFVELEIAALTSGVKMRGEIEDRIRQILSSYKQENKSVIFVIDRIENLFNQNSMLNIGDLFKTLLSRNEARIFGSTNATGLQKINEKDQSFTRHFTAINIDAPSSDQAVEILRGISSRFEKFHQVTISDSAIVSAVNLAKRYVQDKALPDSAVDLLDEASAHKRVQITGQPEDLDRDIRRLASLKTQQAKLSNEADQASAKTLQSINKELEELEPRVNDLRQKFDARKGIVVAWKKIQDDYRKAQDEFERLKGSQNFARIGELEHAILPDLKEKLDRMESAISKEGYAEVSNVVGEQDVAQVICEWTGIPVSKMLEGETDKLLKMEDRLKLRVVGQDEAVSALSRSVKRGRVGLRDPGKPIGSFLFLGPSGVGKTELAKSLAEFLFDDEQAMTRLDMSEFMEKHNAQRLIGSPNGYVGSEEGGELTEAIKRRPYSVLLFDEVEKAHPDVFNLLLQVLDDGRLSDARGNTVDFSNTVVIMTSNMGSQKILGAPEEMFTTSEGQEEMRNILKNEMKAFLRPEFMNRIDDIIIFRPLTKDNLRGIVDIQLRNLEKLISHRNLKLALTEEAKSMLVEISYEPAFGARPLKRSITKNIQNPLAEELLAKGYKDGQTINVDVNPNREFIFAKG